MRSLFLGALACSMVVMGCDAPATTLSDMVVSSPSDMAVLPPDMGCYPMPRTHLEIINACTTAQAVDKTPMTPLLKPDGTLPPLP